MSVSRVVLGYDLTELDPTPDALPTLTVIVVPVTASIPIVLPD